MGDTSNRGRTDWRLRTRQLRFTAFCSHDCVQADEKYVEALQNFFKSQSVKEEFAADVEVKVWDVGTCPKASMLEVPILKAEVEVTLTPDATRVGHVKKKFGGKKLEEEADYALFGRLWCQCGEAQGLLQWLQPSRRKGFWQGGTRFERNVQLSVLRFGILSSLDTFAQRHVLDSHQWSRLYCEFKHDERVLLIYLETKHAVGCVNSTNTLYQLVVPYSRILRVLVKDSTTTGEWATILLQLETMPLAYQRDKGWLRTSNKHGDEPPIIDVEQQIYERTLTLGCACSSVLHTEEVSGCSTLCLGIKDKFKARHILGRLNKRCSRALGFYYVPLKVIDVGPSILRAQTCLKHVASEFTFPVCYAMYAVLSQGYDLSVYFANLQNQNKEAFIRRIYEMDSISSSTLERAFFIIRQAIEERSIVKMDSALETAFEMSRHYLPPKVPPGTCLVRRVFKTPSRVVLLPPQVHSENRILREYDSEFALRVAFRDDNLERVAFTIMYHSQKDAFLQQVVGQFLSEGIAIGHRSFSFLAASSSQLREHGVWMYAKDTKGHNVDSIRKWMGNFRGICGVGKVLARMGQCFSSTEETVSVPMNSGQVQDVPDIKGGMHPTRCEPYIFSDGIGSISPLLLEQVCEKLGLPDVPSAIQIRYAGCKGMLCINPALKGLCMTLRASMKKFQCSSSDKLEVIKVSAPRPICLNRQLITILEQLGVNARVFLHLQQRTVLRVTDALTSETKAVELLYTGSNSCGPSRLKELIPLKKLQLGGYRLCQDPFFRSLLMAIFRDAVDGLRTKSRMTVPPNKGRNMLGVLDETGELAYGQVFVQYTELYSHDESPKVTVLTGTVLVTKCPCLHPGDVRKFTAVDVDQRSPLRLIKDCIVFPIHGDRPHPNEMAGSDLDGDEYIVIWAKDLFFPGPNQQPMLYDDHSPNSLPTSVTVQAMIKFVCDYIKHDSIGVLSNAHLAWADSEGIFSRRCLRLAQKVSKSLDFVKTGRDAQYLERDEKPTCYPDFMEKGVSKNTYRSQRVLGHLYRVCRSLEAVVSTSWESYSDNSKHLALFEYPGWMKYEGLGRQALEQFRTRMETILQQFGIQSEGEVVTGVIHSAPQLHGSAKTKTNMELLVDKQYCSLVEKTKTEFFNNVERECRNLGCKGKALEKTVTLQMASAYYMVTYKDSPDQLQFKRRLYGLPWCLADVMLILLSECNNTANVRTDFPRNSVVAMINGVVQSEGKRGTSAQELAYKVITGWAKKEELLGEQSFCHICQSCLDAVFADFCNYFLPSNGICNNEEAYANEDDRNCDYLEGDRTSVGSIVIGFLRYVGSKFSGVTQCSSCRKSGGQQMNVLMLTALRTYSMLSLSYDPCHLGLPCDETWHEPYQEQLLEGNPVRILVESIPLLERLRDEHEEVEKLLAQWSGVHEVHIRGNRDRRNRTYILVSATGRDWQRWLLEELLLQPWLPDAICSGSLHPFVKSTVKIEM